MQALETVDGVPQFIVGWHFHANALRVLRRGTANMDVLVSLGTNAAYIYSVVSVFHRRALHGRGVEVASMGFFETSALLITFISLGKYLEAHAKGKTSQVRERRSLVGVHGKHSTPPTTYRAGTRRVRA